MNPIQTTPKSPDLDEPTGSDDPQQPLDVEVCTDRAVWTDGNGLNSGVGEHFNYVRVVSCSVQEIL